VLKEGYSMIEKLKYEYRSSLIKIINKIDHFTDEEKNIAIELIDESLNNPDNEYYNIFVYIVEQSIQGYYCIGKRSLTDGVYDLYWIVVEPDSQGQGIGQKLLEHAEIFAKERDGRWLLIETSSQEKYTYIRNFYLRNKYTIVAQINDFYKKHDNLVIFGKYLQA
jgi:ribosomal protein S18 acetylase RimI-like enzyme